MAVEPTNPIIIPEKVCTKVWADEIVIRSSRETEITSVEVIMTPYHEDAEGKKTFAVEAQKVLKIKDLRERLPDAPQEIGAANVYVLNAIQILARMDGVI